MEELKQDLVEAFEILNGANNAMVMSKRGIVTGVDHAATYAAVADKIQSAYQKLETLTQEKETKKETQLVDAKE